MTGKAARRVFRFGVFEADEAAAELRRQGLRVKLHSQPFQVLIMLLERPSELVTREEMRQQLWGTDTFVDFDHGLNTAVNKIREALDDSASQPRYIETVSGKGYRFIAPVRLREPEGEAAAANAAGVPGGTILTTPEELPAPRRTLVRTLLLLVQVMYLAFYLLALGNLREIDDLFLEARLLPPA